MGILFNKEKNSMIFDKEDFHINTNYIPFLFDVLRQMDQKRPVKIAIDLDKTPVIFVLYFKKLVEEGAAEYEFYFKENTEVLRAALQRYGVPYKSIKDFEDYHLTSLWKENKKIKDDASEEVTNS